MDGEAKKWAVGVVGSLLKALKDFDSNRKKEQS